MQVLKVLAHPVNQMILIHPLNDLMQQIGGDQLVYIRPWKI